MSARWLIISACAALAACDTAGDNATVGGVSPSEAKALNEAAEMLDEGAANSAVPPPPADAPVPAS